MIEIRRILCPIDFSDHSRRALDHAIAIARWYKSTVTVLQVFSPAPVAAVGPGHAVLDPIVLTPSIATSCSPIRRPSLQRRAHPVSPSTLRFAKEARLSRSWIRPPA